LGPCQDKRDGTEVGIHGGVDGAVSGDDDGIGAPDGNAGGDDGVGRMGQVICIYPYVPFCVPVGTMSIPINNLSPLPSVNEYTYLSAMVR
jgi:hypothetical protein